MIKILVPAAIISLLAVTAASAQTPLPRIAPAAGLASPDIIFVQRRDRDDDRRRDGRRHRDRDRRFIPGRRYRDTPPGWRRHGYRRPGDWRTRGCILVGPIWFCP